MQNKSITKRIEFSPIFLKRLYNAPIEIQTAFADALELFLEEPHHPTLRQHALQKNFSGVYSIDVTDDWRALYREQRGTHNQLYG